MFEKEAEEYAERGGLPKEKYFFGVKAISFKNGAEFGYNKAKKEIEAELLQCYQGYPKELIND